MAVSVYHSTAFFLTLKQRGSANFETIKRMLWKEDPHLRI